jgi:hypothetical protein
MELTRSTYLLSCYVSTYSRGGKLTDYDAAKVACAAGASIADVYTAAAALGVSIVSASEDHDTDAPGIGDCEGRDA